MCTPIHFTSNQTVKNEAPKGEFLTPNSSIISESFPSSPINESENLNTVLLYNSHKSMDENNHLYLILNSSVPNKNEHNLAISRKFSASNIKTPQVYQEASNKNGFFKNIYPRVKIIFYCMFFPIIKLIEYIYSKKIKLANKKLIEGIKNNDILCVKNSLAKGATLNDKNNFLVNKQDGSFNNKIVLIYVIMMRHTQIAIELINNPSTDPNVQNEHGDTPLITSVYMRNILLVKTLLNSQKINLNIKNNNGDNALIAAITRSDEIAFELINHPDSDLNIQNANGDTPLIIAINKGNIAVSAALLKSGRIDANIQNKDGDTALICAAKMGLVIISLTLIEQHNTNLEIKNKDGINALMILETSRHNQVVHTLINKLKNKKIEQL